MLDPTHTPSRGVLSWPDLKDGGYPRISPEAEPAYLLAIIPHNIGMAGQEIDGNGRLFNAARNAILGLAVRLKTNPVLLAELLEGGALLRAVDGLETIAAGQEPQAASLARATINGMKPHLNPPAGSAPHA